MTLNETIYKCKATRNFEAAEIGLDVLESIKACTQSLTPLHDNIRTEV